MLTVLVAIGNPERRSVDGKQRKPTPSVRLCAADSPLGARAMKQPRDGIWPKPSASLNDRARHDATLAIGAGQGQLELTNDLRDRAVTHQGHPDHEPDHALGRQPTVAQRPGSRRQKPFPDPSRIEVPRKVREALGTDSGRQRERFLEPDFDFAQDHRSVILRLRNFYAAETHPKIRSGVKGLPLTDRHWA